MTYAPAELLALARRLEALIPSAVFSGIVPDASHTYGFHCSARQLGWNRGDYSLADADDWAGAQADPDAAAAFDVSMASGDMRLVHGRCHASWADGQDDRLSGWYEFIGTLDGAAVTRFVSYPPLWGGPYDSDDSHLWHEHTSCLRNRVHDQRAMDALYSVWAGQTYQQWLSGAGEDDGMELTDQVQIPNWGLNGAAYDPQWPANYVENLSVGQALAVAARRAYQAARDADKTRTALAAIAADVEEIKARPAPTATLTQADRDAIAAAAGAEAAGVIGTRIEDLEAQIAELTRIAGLLVASRTAAATAEADALAP